MFRRAPRPVALCPVSQFFSVPVRERRWLVHPCVLANGAPCTRRVKRLRVPVLSELDREVLRPDRHVPAHAPVDQLAVLVNAMFLVV